MNSKSTLEDMIADELGKQIQENMDFEVLADVMCRFGWTRIEMVYGDDQPWINVWEWASANFENDDYQEHAGTWLIKSKKDATMLALRWKCK